MLAREEVGCSGEYEKCSGKNKSVGERSLHCKYNREGPVWAGGASERKMWNLLTKNIPWKHCDSVSNRSVFLFMLEITNLFY